MHINRSAAIQSKVRPHFPDDITVGGHACWVFTTQTAWRCYREAVFWLFLWATETERERMKPLEDTITLQCWLEVLFKCEWSKNNEAKSFSRKLQLIFVLRFTHEHCDAASGSWTFLVKLYVSLCHSGTNPLLEFGLDFLDAHLRVVFRLLMKQDLLERKLVSCLLQVCFNQCAYKFINRLHGWIGLGLDGVEDSSAPFLSGIENQRDTSCFSGTI